MRFYSFVAKYSLGISIFILLVYCSPYFILREDAYVCLYDILEYLPMYEIVASRLDYLLADNDFVIPNVMSGLPRVSYPSEMNLQVWLFYFFPSFYAYLINFLAIHFIAFFGARKFLREQILKWDYLNDYLRFLSDEEKSLIIDFSSLYFALIPFWTLGGISIAGIPLILNAFFNILNKKSVFLDYMVIIVFPFYSYFIFSNIFLIPFLFVIFLVKSLIEKRVKMKFLAWIIIFSVLCIMTEYRILIASIEKFEHHREFSKSEFSSFSSFWSSMIQKVINNTDFYFYAYSDGASKFYPFLYYCSIFVLFLSMLFQARRMAVLIWGLLGLTFILGYSYPLSGHIVYVLQKLLPDGVDRALNGFTFRGYVLNPFVWFLILSLSIIFIFQLNERGRYYGAVYLMLFNIYMLVTVGKVLNFSTYRALESPFANNIKNKNINITFASYFDTKLFNQIDEFVLKNYGLKKTDYRVCAFTDANPAAPLFSPAVLQHNGFYTIDGYCVYYSKRYKELFYRIIKRELDKHPDFYSFKTYGNRVYISSADTLKNGNVCSLDVDYKLLRQLNCKFLFSRKSILNPASHLKFVNRFEGIYWKINLYEIIDNE